MTTEESYQKGLSNYLARDRCPKKEEREWIKRSLNGLSKDASVFEIGSGGGERSDYIETLGYKVQRSDAVLGFLDLLQKRDHALEPILFDLKKDRPPKSDCFFASAVLLHFSHKETPILVEKLRSSLNRDGRLIATWKKSQGIREEIKQTDGLDSRYWSYWTEPEIEALFFNWKECQIEEAMGEKEIWLQVVAFS